VITFGLRKAVDIERVVNERDSLKMSVKGVMYKQDKMS
jgi:hypothetical protein